MPVVTVTGYKKGCKTCQPKPTVTARPPDKPTPINWLGWPNSTAQEREEWKRDHDLYLDRLELDQPFIQGGESEHYLKNLKMYQLWTKADREGRIMQVASVIIVLGPAAGELLAEADIAGILEEGQFEAYYQAERAYNLAARDIIYAIRQALGKRLTIDQIIRLEKLAEEYKDLNKGYKTFQKLKSFYDAIQHVIKGH